MSVTKGWAIVSANGDIDLRTVGPTIQSAVVNWLYTDQKLFIGQRASEAQIMVEFENRRVSEGVSYKQVDITVSEEWR